MTGGAKPAPAALLITITGADGPGITAEMTALLADAGVELLDIEQAVVQGHLSLHMLVSPDGGSERSLLKDLLWKARELRVELDFRVVDGEATDHSEANGTDERVHFAVTLVKKGLSAADVSAAARTVASAGFNIDKIEKLSRGAMSSVELVVSGDAAACKDLQRGLLKLERSIGADVALQREGLLRRAKRLVVIDMDSTLIQQEVIDELARLVGVYDEVAAITERAMNGELDFGESLRLRCAQLAGAPDTVFADVLERIELTPGVERFVAVLKKLGYRIALISGGFIQVAEPLRQRLGLDYAFANELEVRDGKLTGEVVGPVVDRRRKADLLESLAQTERISTEQVVAIGDGANDLDMLDRAGMGIAFNAKRVVQEQAEYALNQHNLDAVLYLLGIREADVAGL